MEQMNNKIRSIYFEQGESAMNKSSRQAGNDGAASHTKLGGCGVNNKY